MTTSSVYRQVHRSEAVAPPSVGSRGGRGSRIRAGTPTASLPGGTSWVTTAPAPVFAPSPISTGATSIVSTPRKTPSPIVVRCLRRAVVVGGDRAGPDVRPGADVGVAEVAHVVLLDAGLEPAVLDLGVVAELARRARSTSPAGGGRTDRSDTSSSTSDSSSTLAQIRQSRADDRCRRAASRRRSRVPSPIDVRPRSMTFGSRSTSSARIDRRRRCRPSTGRASSPRRAGGAR